MSSSKDFILWGSAGHAKVLYDILQADRGNVMALFDNNPSAETALNKVPLYIGEAGLREWMDTHRNIQPHAAVAIGGHRGQDRVAILAMLESYGLKTPTVLHSSACVSPTSQIGRGSQILAMSVVAADASLGRGVIINHGGIVDHECEIGEGCHIAPGAKLCGCVRLGDHVFIGAGATVIPRVSIGSNTIIGAGSVVTRNIPPNSVAYGSPAKIQDHKL